MSQNNKILEVLRILFFEKSILKFSLSAVLGLSFSIAVILCAIGLMDGFEFTLKNSLKSSEGDIEISKRNSFLNATEVDDLREIKEIYEVSGILQGQGFLQANEQSFGVLLLGIESKSFNKVTDFKFGRLDSGIGIGEELAKKLSLKVGDNVTIILAKGSQTIADEPLLESFRISQIVEHEIFEKSLRYVYVKQSQLQDLLKNKNRFNKVKIRLKSEFRSQDQIEITVNKLQKKLGKDFSVKPYWHEFELLLEAVGVEKKTISLILQIIVIISLFNVVALFIYLTEKKASEIFLLRALGVNLKILSSALKWSAIFIWVVSGLLAIILKDLFSYILKNASWFKLPGDIYYLSGIDITLNLSDYILVLSISFAWLLLILFFTNKKIAKESILAGLKKGY